MQKRLFYFPVCVALALSFPAMAQLGGPSGVEFSYAGYLERNGTPVNDSVEITFDVFTQATGGTACDTAVESNVLISDGSFSVSVGPIAEACVLDATVFLELSIEGVSDVAPVALQGRTQVRPALQAYTGPSGGDFDVPQLLTAGSISTGALTTTGIINSGTATNARLTATAANGLGLSVTANADIGGDADIDGTLDVGGRINADGAGNGLVVDNNAVVNGTLTAASLNVTGLLTLPCPPSTTRMGAWCITTNIGSRTIATAIESCEDHPSGPLQVCPLEAILHCDQVNHLKGTANACGTVTDEADPNGVAPGGSSTILTGTIAVHSVARNQPAFDNMSCYFANREDNFTFPTSPTDWTNGVEVCGEGDVVYCCKAAQ